MGRWKRKQYRKKLEEREAAGITPYVADHDPMDSGEADWQEGNEWNNINSNNDDLAALSASPRGVPGWTWKERNMIYQYLSQYKAGCECYHVGLEPLCQDVGVTVGVVEFPLLTRTVFAQPYLCFPTTLTSKNRRMIHECCAESFVYHATIEELAMHNRTIVISIYANGFENLQESFVKESTMANADLALKNESNGGENSLNMRSYHPPISNFRPWYCRKDRPWLLDQIHNPFSSTQSNGNESSDLSSTPIVSNTAASTSGRNIDARGKSLIDTLIDNPEKCVRDNLDVLDFAFWDKVDMSDVPLPPCSSTNGTENSSSSTNSGWTLVDSPEKMEKCVSELWASNPTEIGFDLESLNTSKYAQLTCLLQITSNEGHDYVIDTLAPGVWDMIGIGLAPFFANPQIVKVGHSIGGLDVRSLHRDFGIFVVNAFDTYEAAQILGLSSHGLASVCEHYGIKDPEHYKTLKAEFQATDWRRRPLTKPMLEYGRYDVHFLLRLRWLMMRDLTRATLYDRTPAERDEEDNLVATSMASALAQFKDDDENYDDLHLGNVHDTVIGTSTNHGQGIFKFDSEDDDALDFVSDHGAQNYKEEPALSPENPKASAGLLRMQPNLMKVIARSQERCRDLWSGPQEPFLTHPMYIHILHRARRSEVNWTPAHLQLYEQLVKWRIRVAEEREILPSFVAPLEFLIPVALQCPVSEQALRRISFQLPEMIEEDQTCRDSLLSFVRMAISVYGDGGDGSSPAANGGEPVLEYGNPDTAGCSRVRNKHIKKRKRQFRSKSRNRRLPAVNPAVEWTAAAVVVLLAAITTFALTRHRLK
ncbi:hypothetical protein ACA910_012801 [Epithemia clementina (nom. ined.)]